MPNITDRQREILVLFEHGKSAVEIGRELGISRNAVYQQLQRLRRNGHLPADFTPTGQPVREVRQNPGEDMLRALVGSNGDVDTEVLSHAGTLALAQELRLVRDELDRITRRISLIVPR